MTPGESGRLGQPLVPHFEKSTFGCFFHGGSDGGGPPCSGHLHALALQPGQALCSGLRHALRVFKSHVRGIFSESLTAAARKAGRVSQCSAKVIREAWAVDDRTSSIRSCMYQSSVVIMTSAWVSVGPQA